MGGGNGNGNEQLPSPPSSTPTAAVGVAVTAANVSAPGGGVTNLHDSKSPASGTLLGVGGAVPPSSTGGSRTAPSPSHHSQHPHPHPPSSAAEPPPPSSVTNRFPDPMRRPYTTTTRYPNLDAALQRIGDLEDENYTLRYELDRARAAPPSSSAVVSSAAVDSVLAAFSLFERESTHLEVRSRDARENFARALLGLIGHSRGRDRDVLSSAMIPTGERDWRNSPTDVSRLAINFYQHSRRMLKVFPNSTDIYRIPTMAPRGLNRVPSFSLSQPLHITPSAAIPRHHLRADTSNSADMPTRPLDPHHDPHTTVRSSNNHQ